MSGTTHIRIDQLILDGMPHNTRPEELAAALRRELATRLSGLRPTYSQAVPSLNARASIATPEAAASSVARAVGSILGETR